jgi:hypothetical protein
MKNLEELETLSCVNENLHKYFTRTIIKKINKIVELLKSSVSLVYVKDCDIQIQESFLNFREDSLTLADYVMFNNNHYTEEELQNYVEILFTSHKIELMNELIQYENFIHETIQERIETLKQDNKKINDFLNVLNGFD